MLGEPGCGKTTNLKATPDHVLAVLARHAGAFRGQVPVFLPPRGLGRLSELIDRKVNPELLAPVGAGFGKRLLERGRALLPCLTRSPGRRGRSSAGSRRSLSRTLAACRWSPAASQLRPPGARVEVRRKCAWARSFLRCTCGRLAAGKPSALCATSTGSWKPALRATPFKVISRAHAQMCVGCRRSRPKSGRVDGRCCLESPRPRR